MAANSTAISHGIEAKNLSRVAVVLLGRFLFVLIFLRSGLSNFYKETIAYGASHGVPLAWLAVPAAGVLALAGSLSVLLGYRAKLGAWPAALESCVLHCNTPAFILRQDSNARPLGGSQSIGRKTRIS
jgi:hypothetical protein